MIMILANWRLIMLYIYAKGFMSKISWQDMTVFIF